MTRFVLVHGAFMGAWCWEHVARILVEAGHRVDAPDLPGAGASLEPIRTASLERYVDRLLETISDGDECVLVGHSLGGATVRAALAQGSSRVSAALYLAAFVPGNGQSARQLALLPEGAGEGLRARMTVDGDTEIAQLSVADAATVLFPDCESDLKVWASARIGPHASWISDTVIGPVHDEVPSGYIVCARDRAIPPALQRRIARQAGCDVVSELDADHSPFLSQPERLAHELVLLAAALDSPGPAFRQPSQRQGTT